jgi:DNA polymerase
MLRPALIPAQGKSLVVADWSGIEARVNPWLSNCTAGIEKLSLFARGEDVYKVNASATFHVPIGDVTQDQRQIGKVQELACGFAGGVGAFAAMGRAYGILLPEPQAKRMVAGWRMANPWATPYWQDLEEAYTRAMRNPNHEFKAGRVCYMYDEQHLWYALPSGRVLCYPFAKLEADGITYAKSAWKPAADAKEWPRARLWKGLACENITQAVANDLLRHSMRACDKEGLEIVLTVHDEIVLECSIEDSERVTQRLTEIMCTPPTWARGIPLAVETNTMLRYGK